MLTMLKKLTIILGAGASQGVVLNKPDYDFNNPSVIAEIFHPKYKPIL
ncbi:MAG: hypothetical protein Q7J11_01435 [Candidatus Roizmanbacteria bacterium]|nr:hypothetical protein [Candidatus Roizmanbacteria bacterium]